MATRTAPARTPALRLRPGLFSRPRFSGFDGHRPRGKSYVPGLDGLRGLFAVLIVLFHIQLLGRTTRWLPGGAIGVDVFFAISGFLITDLLLKERRKHGDISLRNFYGRRVLRLGPALACVVLATLIATTAVLGVAQVKPAVLAMTFSANWSRALDIGGLTGADAAPYGRMGWLSATWSLSIEEQFYLLWPGLLLIALRVRSYRLLLGLSCAIAVAAWILRVVLVDGGATQTRIYNGTDTRADALMIGAALAIALARGPGPSKRTMQRVARWIVPAAALGLLYLLVHSSYGDAAMLKYGTVAVTVCSTILIWAMVTENGGAIGKVLSHEPLVWLGRISYPIYLWHLPVIAFLIATNHQELLYPLALPVTLALAAVTFYCLEMPVMRLRRHLRRA